MAVLVLTVAAPATRAASADAPQRVSDGLDVSSRAVYVVDADHRQVHVVTDLTITNTAAGTGRTYSYLDWFSLPVLAEVGAVDATSDGNPLAVTLEPTPSRFLSLVRIDLVPNLFYGQTQRIHVTYDIPARPARSTALSRLNDAFVTFPVLPFGDPGQTDIEVDVPHRFKVEVVGGDLSPTRDGDIDRYTATAIADPLRFDLFVAASDESKLQTRRVDASGTRFDVHGWPDDPQWTDYVAAQIAKGVPELAQRIGLGVPVERIDVFETVTPYLYGYGGWYLRKDRRIDVGDELDPVVVVHEISHSWFNDGLIGSRWVEEGLAQEYAAQVVAATGEPAADPVAPDPTAPGALRLSAWGDPSLTSQLSLEQEQYGYDVSYSVVHAIASELGAAKMQAVLRAASDHTIAYRGSRAPEKADGHTDWKHFLDLLDEVGGATQADQLVATFVATDEERLLLDERATARAAYTAYLADLGGWSAPLAVRSAMGRWSFSTVAPMLDRTRAAKQVADQAAALLAPMGLEATALRREFETTQALDELDQRAARTLAVAGDLAAADVAVHASHGLLERIGLVGGAAGRHLDQARAAFTAGRLDDAAAEARSASTAVADASGVALAGLVAVAGVIVVGVASGRSLRRLRRARATPHAL